MKFVTVTKARNEADILETFIRYHSEMVSLMLIIDHRSTDGSRAIVKSLQDEGIALLIGEDPGIAHRPSEVVTAAVRRLAHDHRPDWILNLDADEFLVVHHPGGLEAALSLLPQDEVTLLRWRTYVPLPTDDTHEPNILRRVQHRRALEPEQHYKALLPGRILGHQIIIGEGNHALYHADDPTPCKSHVTDWLSLAHFPVRTSSQIIQKVTCNWLCRLANPRRKPEYSFQWRALFDRCKKGVPISPEELQEMALRYAWHHVAGLPDPAIMHDPVIANISLRLAPRSPSTPFCLLADTTELLARQIGHCLLPANTSAIASDQLVSPLC